MEENNLSLSQLADMRGLTRPSVRATCLIIFNFRFTNDICHLQKG